MDDRTTQELNRILAKDINDLTDYDKAFLRARKPYVSRKDQGRLADILKPTPEELQAEDQRAETARQQAEQDAINARQELDAPFTASQTETVEDDETEQDLTDDNQDDEDEVTE